MIRFEDLSQYLLRPPGGGIPVFSAGLGAAERLQLAWYGISEKEKTVERIESAWRKSLSSVSAAEVVILGVPSDTGAGIRRGAAYGPRAVRTALLDIPEFRAALSAGKVVDLGDVYCNPHLLEDQMLSQNQIRKCQEAMYPQAMLTMRHQLPVSPLSQTKVILEAFKREHPGVRLFVIGGDHSISYPAVKAVAAHAGPVDILHFDAHPDIYDDYEGNPWSHASPFARILEAGLCKRLVQVGIRTMSPHLQDQVRKFGCVEVVSMRAFDPARVPVLEGPVYVSFDVDGLDPSVAPGVSHWEPGGLTVREAIAVLERQTAPIIGADLVEFNPVRDPSGLTAIVCAKMVREISALAARNGAPAPR
jgi:agmatinase